MARPPQKHVVAAAFVAAMFMNILDATIVNVALPSMARAFGVDAPSAEWVVLGYLLSMAVFIPASGWIGDRFGTKRTFLLALALFTGASALCGIADTLGQLVAFRLIQGVGGGMLTPVGTAMLFRAFPPAERARASRVLIVPTVLAPALGPIIGGLLVEHLSWRWIFLVNVPIGTVVVVGSVLLLHEHREPEAGRFDIAGFVLSGTGLALLLYGLSRGADVGWASPGIVTTLVAGAVALATLVVVELRVPEPLLHLRLLGDRLFRAANLTGLFGYAAFLGTLFCVSLFLQSGRGLSALDAGLTVFPEALGIMIATQLAGRVYPAVGPRRMIAGGLAGVAVSLLLLAQVSYAVDLMVVRALMLGLGVSMAFVFLPLQVATFATISSAQTGRASALYNTQRRTSGALGVAVAATVIEGVGDGDLSASPDPFHAAFVAGAVLAITGAAMALLWIRDRDAAETMRPSGPPSEAAPEAGAETAVAS